MKIGVITDMHLGLRQYGLSEREEDFYIQYNKAIDAFLDAGVDIVIIGGDIFDQPRPSPKSLQVFNEGISQLIDANINPKNVATRSPPFVYDVKLSMAASYSV